ncbi:MAG: GGDEF domain-containing protein [Betaproteobacteria bacterium]|nr:GGDEF domain-containing protein [Betaproteobacteria bacterium]
MKSASGATIQWRRSLLAFGSVALMALVLTLATIIGPVEPVVVAEGCLALGAIAGIFYGLVRYGVSARFSDTDFVAAQLAATFVLLAWLTYRSGDSAAAMPVLPRGDALRHAAARPYQARDPRYRGGGDARHRALHADRPGPGIDFAAAWTQFGALLLAFAWFTYAAGIVLRLRARLSEAHRKLHDLGLEANERASRDTLTGVYHHHHLMEALEREIARAERVGKPLSIARVDLDWLGSVNETHGTAAGDIALKRFTEAAAGALRDVDVFGRYGGKEFLALMPDTDLKGAVIAAGRIRAAVSREPLPEVRGRQHLSCSLGVAEHRKGENTRLLIGRAEAGLNYAKAAGRDRVVALDADGKPAMVEAA